MKYFVLNSEGVIPRFVISREMPENFGTKSLQDIRQINFWIGRWSRLIHNFYLSLALFEKVVASIFQRRRRGIFVKLPTQMDKAPSGAAYSEDIAPDGA